MTRLTECEREPLPHPARAHNRHARLRHPIAPEKALPDTIEPGHPSGRAGPGSTWDDQGSVSRRHRPAGSHREAEQLFRALSLAEQVQRGLDLAVVPHPAPDLRRPSEDVPGNLVA
jgi:hypothetical protein